jgi:poly-gamma-glutamate synthase PgsB/CapB
MRRAADCGAEAIVLECMAVNPLLQSLCELEIVRATHGVITNARPDHLDVMGPTPVDVARALAGTVPVGGTLFTAERTLLAPLADAARDRGSKLVAVGAEDVAAVGPDDLSGFGHLEHPDNVALALRVCESLGVDRDTALVGMWASQPDPGVMTRHEFHEDGKRLTFVNGFAANDPESTASNWRQVVKLARPGQSRVIVVNCRTDRADRSRQMAEMCARWSDANAGSNADAADFVFAVGCGTDVFLRRSLALGIAGKVTAIERITAEALIRRIAQTTADEALVMGVGNIAGIGMDLVNLSRERAAAPLATPAPTRTLQLQEAA